jgi:hypothetical protein
LHFVLILFKLVFIKNVKLNNLFGILSLKKIRTREHLRGSVGTEHFAKDVCFRRFQIGGNTSLVKITSKKTL